MSITPQLKT